MSELTIEQYRRLSGLSGTKMAEKLGINYDTYKKWENDPGLFKIDAAFKFAEIVGFPFTTVFSCMFKQHTEKETN